jgi:hypothetical protein
MIVLKMPFTPGTGTPSTAELSSPKRPFPTNFVVCIKCEGFSEDGVAVVPTVEIGAGVTEVTDGSPVCAVETVCPLCGASERGSIAESLSIKDRVLGARAELDNTGASICSVDA